MVNDNLKGTKLNITTLAIIKNIADNGYELFFYDPKDDYTETTKVYTNNTTLTGLMCLNEDIGVFVLSLGNITVLNNNITSDAKNFLIQYKTGINSSWIKPTDVLRNLVTSCLASGVGGTFVGMIIGKMCKKPVDKITNFIGECFSNSFTSTKNCIGNILEKLGNLLTRNKPPTEYRPIEGPITVYNYHIIESLINRGDDIRRVEMDQRIRIIESIQGDLRQTLHHYMPEILRTRLIEYNSQLERLREIYNTTIRDQTALIEEFENIKRITSETLERFKRPIIF